MGTWKTVFLIFYFGFTFYAAEIKNYKLHNSIFELLFKNLLRNYKNIGGIFFTAYLDFSVLHTSKIIPRFTKLND